MTNLWAVVYTLEFFKSFVFLLIWIYRIGCLSLMRINEFFMVAALGIAGCQDGFEELCGYTRHGRVRLSGPDSLKMWLS